MFMQIFISWFPMLLLIAVWIIYMRRTQGGGMGGNNFGKSKAKMLEEDKMTVTFTMLPVVKKPKKKWRNSSIFWLIRKNSKSWAA